MCRLAPITSSAAMTARARHIDCQTRAACFPSVEQTQFSTHEVSRARLNASAYFAVHLRTSTSTKEIEDEVRNMGDGREHSMRRAVRIRTAQHDAARTSRRQRAHRYYGEHDDARGDRHDGAHRNG